MRLALLTLIALTFTFILSPALFAQPITITSPIPGFGIDSIEIKVVASDITCTFSVYNRPILFRNCSISGHYYTTDTFDYTRASSLGFRYPLVKPLQYIFLQIDTDIAGKFTYWVISSAGVAGPNQFPGQP